MVSQPDLPHYSHTEDVSVTSLLLEPSVMASVAGGAPIGHAQQPIRFDDFRPVSASSAQLWKATVDYVKNSVLADDAMTTPLVIGHVSRLLAAVTLSAFPNTLSASEMRYDRTDANPVLLRRGIDYLERNVGNDVALGDIADAIHVTPRAVQYMFRKHLDTTPLQYLRRLRLHRAHQDLLNCDRAHDTVTAVAARWGFMHSGRFAVMYRETYGQSPHATLRG
jgi:AraC-like DNA-binding protein